MYNPDTKQLTMAARNFENPNGLCFSPDERILYVNDSSTYRIVAFDVHPDGALTGERLIRVTEGKGKPPDGMKIDEFGNIVCAAQKGLHWLSPDGDYLGMIIHPEHILNLSWGGEDFRTLYLTSSYGVYTLRTRVRGCRYNR
jgi:gluconolactonase